MHVSHGTQESRFNQEICVDKQLISMKDIYSHFVIAIECCFV